MFAGEAAEMVGMSMTYTLFEWAKENLETLLEAQPESLIVEAMERVQVITNSHTSVIIKVVHYVPLWLRLHNPIIRGIFSTFFYYRTRVRSLFTLVTN